MHETVKSFRKVHPYQWMKQTEERCIFIKKEIGCYAYDKNGTNQISLIDLVVTKRSLLISQTGRCFNGVTFKHIQMPASCKHI